MKDVIYSKAKVEILVTKNDIYSGVFILMIVGQLNLDLF
jgi:hypothetical protein